MRFLLFLIFFSPLLGQIEIDPLRDELNLNLYTNHFSDTSGNLSALEVLTKQWSPRKEGPIFPDNKNPQWIKYELVNKGTATVIKHVFIPYHCIFDIHFYNVNENGKTVLLSKQGTRNTVFNPFNAFGASQDYTIKPGKTKTILIRMDRTNGPLRGSSYLMSTKHLINTARKSEGILWFWLGVVFFSVLFALILFYFLKRELFLYYVMLNIGVTTFMSTQVGISKFIIPSDLSNLTVSMDYTGAFLVNMFFPLFLNSLVPLSKRSPKMWRVLMSVVALIGVLTALSYIPTLRNGPYCSYIQLSIMVGSAFVFTMQPTLLLRSIKNKDTYAIPLFLVYSIYVSSVFVDIISPNTGVLIDKPDGHNLILLVCVLEMLSFLSIMGVETFKVYKERSRLLEDKKGHQRELVSSMIKAQEKERNRVGRELHDMVGGNMAIIKKEVQQENDKAQKVIAKTIDAVRTLSSGLVTPRIKNGEFMDEITEMCHLFNSQSLQTHLIFHDWPADLNDDLTTHLYRITQESLHNVQKHAQASQVYLQFFKDVSQLAVTIEDNGIGFNPLVDYKGIGIRNIKKQGTTYWSYFGYRK